ncbi:N-acetyltransferase [Raphidocelis subcapitata]|uniref:N-acetyltransferase n=1 Tax=Raphidocelis subcapitata TaxID=307507 RepID=A0A2V0NP67_9CHLO|nr:N-acetyltransferase [Raphidocelis subcapitata]|eukprot:GBF89069.1 N-acetyltransferase [Raphidocelis subcapitata]
MKQGRLEAFYAKRSAEKANGAAAAGAAGAAEAQQQQRKRKAERGDEGAAGPYAKENQPPQDAAAAGTKPGAAAVTPASAQPAKPGAAAPGSTPAATAAAAAAGGAKAGPPAPRGALPRRSMQTFLDLGQRDFSASSCPSCGMVYARGREDDEALHRAHCAAGSQGIKFQSWSCERVLLSDALRGRLLMVLPSDPASQVKKVGEVAALVERLHALTPGWLLAGDQWKAFLYISTQRRVVGLLVAEPLRQAFRVAAPAAAATAAAEGPAGGEEADSGAAVAPGEQQQQQQQQPPEKRGIWRGLHGRQQSHAQQGLSGGTGASSLGSGGTGARGADSCPPPLRAAGDPGLRSPASAGRGQQEQQQRQAAAPGRAEPSPAAAAAAATPAAAAAATPPAPGPAPAPGPSRVLCIDRSRPARAALGVRMVWVSAEHRRRGVASRLLDAARSNMVQCYVAPRAQAAFTQPTEAGAALAAAYVGPQGWLIYGV